MFRVEFFNSRKNFLCHYDVNKPEEAVALFRKSWHYQFSNCRSAKVFQLDENGNKKKYVGRF